MCVAFAFYTCVNRVCTLNVVCSSPQARQFTAGNKTLSQRLLDYVYENLQRNECCILRLQPATAGLIKYYTQWKRPTINPEYRSVFSDYLIYGHIEQLTYDELKDISTINLINNVLQYLGQNASCLSSCATVKEKRERLTQLCKDSSVLTAGIKNQIQIMIDSLKITCTEDLKTLLY